MSLYYLRKSPSKLLSGMVGAPISVGWILHFMVGIIFALLYTYLLAGRLEINVYLKGALFGIIVFVIAQVGMMGVPKPQGAMVAAVMGSPVGHVIFGMAVSRIVGHVGHRWKSCETGHA